jgi:hypothetical protein
MGILLCWNSWELSRNFVASVSNLHSRIASRKAEKSKRFFFLLSSYRLFIAINHEGAKRRVTSPTQRAQQMKPKVGIIERCKIQHGTFASAPCCGDECAAWRGAMRNHDFQNRERKKGAINISSC